MFSTFQATILNGTVIMILLIIFFITLTSYIVHKIVQGNKYFAQYKGPPSVAFLASDIIFSPPEGKNKV